MNNMSAANRRYHEKQRDLFIDFTPPEERMPVQEQSLIKRLIERAAPELLVPSRENLKLLQDIDDYLFASKTLRNAKLARRLPAPLYDILYELKRQLRSSSLSNVAEQIAQEKAEMGVWLRRQIQEDEEEE